MFPMQPNILLRHTARRGWSRVVGEGGTAKSKEGKVQSGGGGGGVEGELRARTVKSKATWGRVESRAKKRGGEVLGDILIVTYH